MTHEKKLKVCIGDTGNRSRVYFDGETIPGVSHAKVCVDADELTTVVITVNAMSCEIIQENVE